MMDSTVRSPTHVPITTRLLSYPTLFLLTSTVTALGAYIVRPSFTEYTLCSRRRQIYTVNDAQPQAQCITIQNDRISRVGAYEEVAMMTFQVPLVGWNLDIQRPTVSFVDAAHTVVPGLADAHAHIIENGWMMQLPLTGSASVQDVIERIKHYIQSHPDILNDHDRWIEGMGWDQTKWEGEAFPTAADLGRDPLLKGRLISLTRIDCHARWVSPRVLDIMGKLPEDSEIAGGWIVRNADGKPTGVFVDNAAGLIPSPSWNDQQLEDYFIATANVALKYGLTSIHDAWSPMEMIALFKRKAEEDAIPLRLYLMGNVPLPTNGSESDTATYVKEKWNHGIPRFVNYGKQGRLTLRSVKLFVDGSLGSWGAALHAPYSDNPASSGNLMQPAEILRAAVRRFWKDGMQVNIHCTGDKANRIALDIFEELIEEKGTNVSTWRPRIEHAQIVDEHDFQRFGKLGVIASVQPTHATSDMGFAEKRLGLRRMKGAYAYATLLRHSRDNMLPLGSDFPVEGVNPLLGFYAAVKRLGVDGTSPHGSSGWYPDERLTRKQALKGMTLDAAYASFQEHDIGSLEVGKKADFVVFDRDFVGCIDQDICDGSEILEAKVKTVVIDGKVAWGELPRSETRKAVMRTAERLMVYARALTHL